MEVWVLLAAAVAPTFILSRALKPVWSLYVLLVDSDTLCPISSQLSVSFFWHCPVFQCNRDYFGSRVQWNRLAPPQTWHALTGCVKSSLQEHMHIHTRAKAHGHRHKWAAGKNIHVIYTEWPSQRLLRVLLTHLQSSLFISTRDKLHITVNCNLRTYRELWCLMNPENK